MGVKPLVGVVVGWVVRLGQPCKEGDGLRERRLMEVLVSAVAVLLFDEDRGRSSGRLDGAITSSVAFRDKLGISKAVWHQRRHGRARLGRSGCGGRTGRRRVSWESAGLEWRMSRGAVGRLGTGGCSKVAAACAPLGRRLQEPYMTHFGAVFARSRLGDRSYSLSGSEHGAVVRVPVCSRTRGSRPLRRGRMLLRTGRYLTPNRRMAGARNWRKQRLAGLRLCWVSSQASVRRRVVRNPRAAKGWGTAARGIPAQNGSRTLLEGC